MRRKLLSDIEKRRQFYQKNEYIDKLIEFDQRFFCDGYQQFQLMISDVRAQLKIVEEVLKMRRMIERENNSKVDKIIKISQIDGCD